MPSTIATDQAIDSPDLPLDERTKRRRRGALLLAILIVLASMLGIDYLRNRGGGPVRDFASGVQRSLESFFRDRSPGARLAILQAKPLGERDRTSGPRQRALGKTFPPENQSPFFFPGDMPLDLVPPPALMSELPLPTDFSFIPPGGGFPSFPGFPGPGNPGNYLPPPPNPPEPPEPPIVPGVPEPSTWLTMLIGFGTCGWVIRRSRRRAPKTQS